MHFYQENTEKKILKATIHRKIINLKALQRKILILHSVFYNFDGKK